MLTKIDCDSEWYEGSDGKLYEYGTYLCSECGEMFERRVRNNTEYCHSCAARISRTTHGKSHTKEYDILWHMIDRCYNPNNPAYKDYGGRGITVCDRWLESYENFLEDVGYSPSKYHTLDRINNDDGYHENNWRWSTVQEQSNNRRSNIFLEYKGIRMTMAQWSRLLKVNYSTIKMRRYAGLLTPDILSEADDVGYLQINGITLPI